jgi:hypothetical protein
MKTNIAPLQAEDIVLNVLDVNLDSGIASVEEEISEKLQQLVESVKKCGFDAEVKQ